MYIAWGFVSVSVNLSNLRGQTCDVRAVRFAGPQKEGGDSKSVRFK